MNRNRNRIRKKRTKQMDYINLLLEHLVYKLNLINLTFLSRRLLQNTD
jgi:hypothetical protein